MASRRKPSSVRVLSKISDLSLDPRNANRGIARGLDMLEHSLRQYGAGRSILVDRSGRTIAGNKTLERAAELGLPIEVVRTKGDRLVVVQREDLDLDDPRARELAIADNRVAEMDLSWDTVALADLIRDGADLTQLFSTEELDALLASTGDAGDDEESGAVAQLGDLEYRVIVDVSGEAQQRNLIEKLEAEGFVCRPLIS